LLKSKRARSVVLGRNGVKGIDHCLILPLCKQVLGRLFESDDSDSQDAHYKDQYSI
jgi:hypothetical protein